MRLTAAFFVTFLAAAGLASEPGLYIVVLNPAASGSQALHDGDVAAAGGGIAGRDYGLLYVRGSSAVAGILAAHPGVKYVQPVGDAERPSLAARPSVPVATPAHKLVTDQSPPAWSSGTYHYDGASDIFALGQIATGDTAAGDGQLTHYTYDTLMRIRTVQVQDPSHPDLRNEAYQYDPYGNLTDYRFNGTGAYTHIPVSTATNRADPTFGYDVAGNVISDSSTVYARDALNMIVTAAHNAVTDINLYTADDERVAHLADGAWTWSFRGIDNKMLRQYRSPAANPLAPWLWTEDYVYAGGGRLLAAERPAEEGGRRYFHLDHLGTPRLITGTNGQALEQHDYTAFGDEATFLTQTSMRQDTAAGFDREEPMHFTGHERDFPCGTAAETACSVDYMHARYYSASVGRFLSIDSSLDIKRTMPSPRMWNRYAYVSNEPINKVDRDGRAENDFRCVECTSPEMKAAFDHGVNETAKVELPIIVGVLVGAELPALARAAFTAFPRTFIALMGIGAGMTGAPSMNLGSGARPIAGAINVDNLSPGFRGSMQQIQVAGDALALPFKNGSIGNVTAQNFPSLLLGQGGQQLASELGRTMQSGSALTITTQTPGALQAFGRLLGEAFTDIVINSTLSD